MYNLSGKLLSFYNDVVRLKEEDRNKLREYKSLNIDRVKSGLDVINERDRKTYPYPSFLEQGSIPMHTANRHDDNDYDIDVALIFPKDEIPSSAYETRKLIEKALKEKSGNFLKQPEARTNAVTVFYSEGYHVDFAVYRSYNDQFGREVTEHAGPDWHQRDPKAITEWFNNEVTTKSPKRSLGATVESNQLRRIVRLIKKFTKSRDNWSLPGGLIISVLTVECYKPDSERDDKALVATIKSIHSRLEIFKKVFNPTSAQSELTEKKKYQYEVNRLTEKLDRAIKRFEKLDEPNCCEEEANDVWKWFFNSDYWNVSDSERMKKSLSECTFSGSNLIELSASLYNTKNGIRLNSNVPNGALKVPKNMWLKFQMKTTITPPFDITWIVENKGDEAEAVPDLGHETPYNGVSYYENFHWERTAYKGRHKLICEVSKNDSVLASKTFEVLIQK